MFLLPTLFLISCHVTSGSYTFLSIGDWGANTIPDRGSMSYQKNVGAVASQLTKSYRNADAKFVLNLVRTSNSIATKSFKQTKIRFHHSLLTHVDELLSFFLRREIARTLRNTQTIDEHDREILSIGVEFKTHRIFKSRLILHLIKISRWTGTLFEVPKFER